MAEAVAIPVVCDHDIARGAVLRRISAAGKVLQIREWGAEYDGWSISWPQLVLVLQDAAAGKRYEARP